MNANNSKLQAILNSPNQYRVPVFQRFYSWTTKEWEDLWGDVEALADPAQSRSSVFMGSLVVVPIEPDATAKPRYEIIDGQQRMVTYSLLLCALRDAAQDADDSGLAAEITDTCLVHPHRTGDERFRVFPRHRDMDAYVAAVDGEIPPQGGIREALRFFSAKLGTQRRMDGSGPLRELFGKIQQQVEFVVITLNDENPYRIFRSLNSTGVALSDADLIRNFVFMHVEQDVAEHYEAASWRPIENHFRKDDGEVDSRALSEFFRDFLMRDGVYVKRAHVFTGFEAAYVGDSFDPDRLARDLLTHAEYYTVLRSGEHASTVVERALVGFRSLGFTTTYPLLLNLLHRHRVGTLSDEDLTRCVEMVAGFLLRRHICGDTSRGYGHWFANAAGAMQDSPVDDLFKVLTDRGWPSDDRVRQHFVAFNLYESSYAHEVLEAFERSYGHKELADLSKATVEHIMPQTLNGEWATMLGDQAADVHRDLLHTPGNLTLSAYNPELGNMPFPKKREKYSGSHIDLTKGLAEHETWDGVAIRRRSEELANLLCEIWMGADAVRS